MAQSTPTHASGFQLFTVAMTGHAEEWVQLPQHKVELNHCCPNAIKESRSERVGLYRNEQGVFAFLALLKIIALHQCHQSHRRNVVYSEGTITGKQGRTPSMQCSI